MASEECFRTVTDHKPNRIFDSGLGDRIAALARAAGVHVEFRELAGDIAHALGRLAEILEAEMIIVGRRPPWEELHR